ncbi:SRPBCC family protein [Blastococcus sp. SYSU D00669]
MQLENSFTVPVPIDEAWRVLLDIERIAPCMPGAALDSVTGDDFTGRVKVKLGPINLTYQGKASFIEKDEAAHKAVIDARGKDQRGNGTAAAVVTAQLKPEGDVTRVDVLTDLNITGRPAQFGRGVMTDVGNKLLGQFADKLAAQLGAGEPAPEPSPAAKAAATATGAVEEIAASAEGAAADGTAAKKAAAATKQAAASATERVTATSTVPAKSAAPAKKATPAKKAAPAAADTAPAAADTAPAAADTAPAATDTAPATPAAAAPSAPSVPAAEATTPAAAAPPTPSAPSPAAARTVLQSEPEPIDLLEVAGGAAMARYAKPAGGLALLLLFIFLVARRRRD